MRELIGSTIFWYGTSAAEILPILDLLIHPGDNVVDVSANLGEVTLRLAFRVGPNGSVNAFEPVPILHDRLVEMVDRNELHWVTPHRMALSDVVGQGTIHSGDSQMPSGWRNDGKPSLAYEPVYRDGAFAIPVDITTMDDILMMDVDRIDFVKIDVEGLDTKS